MGFANASVPGVLPDYGAIFMSNSETRLECFERKIFGLPSSYSPFVKQVKSGMILFLYDSDNRHLYGVFRAVSDGTMDIVQHAYSSSGRRFPAQVKFTTMWECEPLAVSEFRECIKDNFFTAHKFKFGLSDHQVQSLLHLFNQRKLKLPMSPRQCTSQLTRSGRSEQPRTTLSNVGVAVEQHKVVSNDNVENLNYNDVGLYSRYFVGKDQQQTDGGMLMGSDQHHVDNDFNRSLLRENHMNALVNEEILRDDKRISPYYAFENKGYIGNDCEPILSRGNFRNTYVEVNRPAADHSFMKSARSIPDPFNSREHTSHLHYEGNNDVANHNLVTNTNHDLDQPRSLFGDGIAVVANHSLTRNVINGFDPTNTRDLPQSLFREISSDTRGHSLIGNHMMEDTYNLGNEDYNGNSSSGNRVRSVDYDERNSLSMVPCEDNLYHSSNMGRNSAYSLGTLKKIAEDERLIFSGEEEYNPDNSQFVQPSSHSLDPRMSNQSRLTFKGDTVLSNPDGYNPDSPIIHYDSSTSFLADRNSDDLNTNLHADINNVPKIYSLSQNQPFQHQMQQPGYLNSLPEVKTCSCSNCVSGISHLNVGYPDTTRIHCRDYEASNGLHASEVSLLAPSAIRKIEIQRLNHEGPYSTIPHRDASFFNENQHLAVLTEEQNKKMPWREGNVYDVCSSNSSHLLGSTKQNCKEDCHYDHNTKPHRELKGVDIPKKRTSVFERLTVADKVNQRAKNINNSSDDEVDVSVKEIMGMLRRDHSHWTKAGKTTSPIETSVSKKCLSILNKNESSKSKMMSIDHASDYEDNLASNLVPDFVPVYQDRPIPNFKRRSQLREPVNQNLSSDSVDDASPKIQPKKRKLIRPDFGKICSSQVTEVNMNNMDTTSPATPEPNPATDRPTKRKLVCRDLVKTDSPLGKDDNINDRDKTNPATSELNPATDASPQEQPMKRNLVRQDMVKTDSPHAKDDYINNRDETNVATPELKSAADSPHAKDDNINNGDKYILATSELNMATDSPHAKVDNINNRDTRNVAIPELKSATDSPHAKDDYINNRGKTNPTATELNSATDSPHAKDDHNNNRDETNLATPELNSATDSPQAKDDNIDNHNSNKIASVSSEHRMDTETKNCEETVNSVCETIAK